VSPAILLAAAEGVWMPESASTVAPRTDALFHFLLALSVFFFVLVVGTMTLFVVKYRRRRPGQRTSPIAGHHKLEVTWAVIPALLLVLLFGWGFRDYIHLAVPPGEALEIRVTAQKWFWTFDYPREGVSSSELAVPVNRPVKLTMSSTDLIHSFFVPAFRIKRDLVPNRYTVAWFEATELGSYDILCAEYCGQGHSRMLSRVRVLTEREYQAWIDSGGGLSGKGLSSVEFGKLLFRSKGCASCHSVAGAAGTGPPLDGKYGALEELADGKRVKVDDNYLRESIVDPAARVVAGFEPVMPTYAGKLKDKQMNAIIDYLKSIRRK
jgi:cytochrome c oxidase subunit 2